MESAWRTLIPWKPGCHTNHSLLPFVESVTVPLPPTSSVSTRERKRNSRRRDFMTYYYIALTSLRLEQTDVSPRVAFPRRGNNNFFPAPIGKGNGHLLASFCVRISIHSHARLPFLRESKRTKIDLSLGGAR